MKVILTKDVKGTGRAHTAVDVSDGHAINFLIPRGLAQRSTPMGLVHAEKRASQHKDKHEVEVALVTERLAALAEGTITITKKANEQGHLYDAVDAAEIAAATELPKEAIHLEKPIKELGTFEIPVATGATFGKISITIEAE